MIYKFRKLLIFFIIVITIEIFLRFFGYGNPPLFRYDNNFEYINIKNQEINTLFFKYKSNNYSLRSEEVFLKDKENILLLGDSVINGGRFLSNNDLVNYKLNESFDNFNFINISSISWGPNNTFEYLKKFGNFNAKKMFLIFSSHDAQDCMTFNKKLDEIGYSTKKPLFGIQEIFEILYKKIYYYTYVQAKEEVKDNCNFNPGWLNLFNYSKINKMDLYVILHPTILELKNKKYDYNGEKIIKFLKEKNINYYLEINDSNKNYYRDEIHLNEKGQLNLANIIKRLL